MYKKNLISLIPLLIAGIIYCVIPLPANISENIAALGHEAGSKITSIPIITDDKEEVTETLVEPSYTEEVGFYTHSPSAFTEDGTRFFFYTSNEGSLVGKDSIYLKKGDEDAVQILSPSTEYNVGEPSVVKTEVNYKNKTYDYVMIYTSSNKEKDDNKILIAFSNDLRSWVRCEQTIAEGTVSQPSAIVLNDNLMVAYVNKDTIKIDTYDMSVNKTESRVISKDGITNKIADIDIAVTEGYLYLATSDGVTIDIYRTDTLDVEDCVWENVSKIDSETTGYKYNFGPCFNKTEIGLLSNTVVSYSFSDNLTDYINISENSY